MKNKLFVLFSLTIIILTLSACKEAGSLCSAGEIKYRSRENSFPALSNQDLNPQSIEIKGKTINFDHVVSGQLCNNQLKGTVYVGCDIELYEIDEKSLFLDGCEFSVDPGTIIYVAAHNNAAYFKGCVSCHASQE